MYLVGAQTKTFSLSQGAKVLLGSLLLALSAQVALFLPFSPVPVTLQTVAVLFLAARLGKKAAAMAVMAYIAEGLMGLPVFAGGSSGLNVFLSPRGLFLVSFILMAYLAGALYEGYAKGSALKTFISSSLSSLALYAVVVPALALMIGMKGALVSTLPFLLVDFVKVLFCNGILTKK